ncbi:MAG: mechanosensitive ion channel protein MscS, partial [Bacteroidota bacterium]
MFYFVEYKSQILTTLLVVLIVFLLNTLTKRGIRRFGRISAINMNNRKIIFYLSNLLFYGLGMVLLGLIWGVNVHDLSVF